MQQLAHPLFFGPVHTRLFGWFYPATQPAVQSVAVLVCNPYGFEAQCAHQSIARIACDVAQAGFAALRFDYAGTGDSSGDEFEPELLQRWIASVHQACDFLKAQSGASRVVLVGLRLGAAIATQAALEREDIAGLVAIAPVVHGRKYLRELKVLGSLFTQGSTPEADDAPLQAAGFVLTRHACAQVAAINLTHMARLPAPQVLLVERDDMGAPNDWAPALQALGAQVTRAQWPGYGAMMVDPINSLVPEAILAGLLATLREWQGQWAAAAPSAHSAEQDFAFGVDSGPLPTLKVSERVVHIDSVHARMTGILTRAVHDPRAGSAVRERAVIVMNSGAVHHIGQNRLWVRIAREWAQKGCTVLRLDLSGIGDSPRRLGAVGDAVYSAEAAGDLDAAVAYMRKHFPDSELQLLGLCSGAYHAFKGAVRGLDIQAAMLINPLTFHNWRPPAAGAFKKLARGKVSLHLVQKKVRALVWHLAKTTGQKIASIGRGARHSELGAELHAAHQHGIALRFVFSVGEPGIDMLRQQSAGALEDMVQRGAVSIDYITEADHTFTRMDARERLMATLNTLYFGAPAGQAEPAQARA